MNGLPQWIREAADGDPHPVRTVLVGLAGLVVLWIGALVVLVLMAQAVPV